MKERISPGIQDRDPVNSPLQKEMLISAAG
jgi:hypothetical protein